MTTIMVMAYISGTLLQLGIGVVHVIVYDNPDGKDEITARRIGARMALTCWAWPAWAAYGIIHGTKHLTQLAGWGKQ